MNVLGITWGKTSGCSIFVDNKIIFAASEERYTRRKSEQSYPINAIESGLNYCKIKPEELDYVLIASNKIPLTAIMVQYFTNFSVKDHLFANEKYWYQKLVEKRPLKLIELFKEKIDFTQYPFDMDFFKELDLQKIEHATTDDSEANILVSNFFKDTISHHLKIDITKIIHVEHDSCHAAYALYGSPIREDGTLIFTADAFGVLPPISKLTNNQAMYHFISGYTSKIAGTEEGVIEPQATFSACFAAPFMPLHPTIYANMLGNKIKEGHVNVWLINTGWSGGEYGKGNRIRLKYTRAMITAAMNNKLDNIDYLKHEIFQLNMPKTCPGVPEEILNPSNTWQNKLEYLKKTKR